MKSKLTKPIEVTAESLPHDEVSTKPKEKLYDRIRKFILPRIIQYNTDSIVCYFPAEAQQWTPYELADHMAIEIMRMVKQREHEELLEKEGFEPISEEEQKRKLMRHTRKIK